MKNITIILCPVLRHNYTFNTIVKQVPIAGVIRQHRVRTNSSHILNKEYQELNDEHFQARNIAEAKWYTGNESPLAISSTLDINSNNLTDPKILEFIKANKTDILITLGCALVPAETFKHIDYGLNFHLGMSPRYRGSAGLLWPIYNMDPERIATSILVLEDNIDGGPVVHHSRPNMSIEDGIHDIACKTVMAGASDLVNILRSLYEDKPLIAQAQKTTGRIYYESAYHPRHLKVLGHLMKSDVIKEYLDNKDERDSDVKLVKCPYTR